MNPNTKQSFFEKYEFVIPLALFIVFLALTLPGIAWGAPDTWHPDEVVVRSIKALHGEWKFSEINFDYPDLPQYAMYWLGRLLLALGQTDTEVLIAARVLSAVLAGLTVVLTYFITRRIGGSVYIAGLSGLFLICVNEMEHNGRFAHNDMYLVFFTTLTVFLILAYFKQQNKLHLYASFITVGMAASSKYIGGSLLIVPLLVYLIGQRRNLWKEPLKLAETLFISGVLTFLGYSLGTPKALFWMTYYFKRVFAALQWQVGYGKQPGSVRGIMGQYAVMLDGLGAPLAVLFAAAFVWAGYQVFKGHRDRDMQPASRTGTFAILLGAALALDLPMLISYNYQLRYFLTLMPFLAVLAAFLIEDLYERAKRSSHAYSTLVNLGVLAIILYSLTRALSQMLLVMNDARIPASAYITGTLRAGTSLEYTYYPPTLPEGFFEREHNYPIHFVKSALDSVPTSKKYEFNVGEPGLVERQTDYLIIDSFTYNKFNDPYTCTAMPVECDFFKQLAAGQSAHYKLFAEFSYSLPAYVPQIEVTFVNPAIRIYERIQ